MNGSCNALFRIVNKIDLARVQGGPERIEISAKTGEGHRPADRGVAGEGGRPGRGERSLAADDQSPPPGRA